jgi:hypothetical protein
MNKTMSRFFKRFNYLKLFFLLIISKIFYPFIIGNFNILYRVFENLILFLYTDSSELSFNILRINKVNSPEDNSKSLEPNQRNILESTDTVKNTKSEARINRIED